MSAPLPVQDRTWWSMCNRCGTGHQHLLADFECIWWDAVVTGIGVVCDHCCFIFRDPCWWLWSTRSCKSARHQQHVLSLDLRGEHHVHHVDVCLYIVTQSWQGAALVTTAHVQLLRQSQPTPAWRRWVFFGELLQYICNTVMSTSHVCDDICRKPHFRQWSMCDCWCPEEQQNTDVTEPKLCVMYTIHVNETGLSDAVLSHSAVVASRVWCKTSWLNVSVCQSTTLGALADALRTNITVTSLLFARTFECYAVVEQHFVSSHMYVVDKQTSQLMWK